jgi:hypothetical protein
VVAAFAIEADIRFGLFWAVVGLAVGAVQSLVLVRESSRVTRRVLVGVRWTLLSGIGLGIGALLGIIPSYAVWLYLGLTRGVHWGFTTAAWTFALTMAGAFTTLTASIAIGLVQQRVLRKVFRESDHWASFTVVGWLLACTTRYGMLRIVPGGDIVKGLVAGATGGLWLGGITGLVLARMLKTRQAAIEVRITTTRA